MNCANFELPDVNRVAKACAEFIADSETKIVEAALTDLFAQYPSNTNEAHVLLKVVALNELYSTQIPLRAFDRPNVFDIARCIPKLNLDQAFSERSLKIVNEISTTVSGEENHQPFLLRDKVRKLAQAGCVPDVGPQRTKLLYVPSKTKSN